MLPSARKTCVCWSFVGASFVAGVLAGVLGYMYGTRGAEDGGAVVNGGHVTGIGGVFFKSRDTQRLRAWYSEHLGIESGSHGVTFHWRESDKPNSSGFTVWSVFPEDTEYFGPGAQDLMINYRVKDLDVLLAKLRSQGVHEVREQEEYDYGRFAWILDADGHRVELWEPARD